MLSLTTPGIEFLNPVSGGQYMSSHSSHHAQVVLLAQFSLYVHISGLRPHSFIQFTGRSRILGLGN